METSKSNEHLYPEQTIRRLKIELKWGNFGMYFFATLSAICFFLFLHSTLNTDIKIHQEIKNFQGYCFPDSITKEISYQYTKQLCINNIMLTEGFVSTVYKDAAGYNTIGFGHQIKPVDNIPNKIDFKTAYIILECDFNGCIAYARELGYIDDTPKQLAVAHAIYCLGVGTVQNMNDFKTDILKYVYYRKPNGGIVNSDYLFQSRKFEKAIYDKKY